MSEAPGGQSSTGCGPVLVTGGHGVIGSWVCRELVERGVPVTVLDIAPRPAVSFAETARVTAVAGDVLDSDLVRATIEDHGIRRILHLAAIVGQPCEDDPVRAVEVNALGTARVVEAAADLGIERLVAMSTKGVLGPLEARYLHPLYEPVPVDAPTRPQTIYETTKYTIEPLVRRERAAGRSVTAIRLATTWGPGKSGATHAGLSLHSDVLTRAAAGESSRLDVHPDQGYDLVYYRDVARGLAAAIVAAEPPPRPVYHIGSGRITSMGEFARAVESVFPGIQVELGDRLVGGRNCLLDVEPARADLGYEPTWLVEDALRDAKGRLAA